jgi:hypothetical protein
LTWISSPHARGPTGTVLGEDVVVGREANNAEVWDHVGLVPGLVDLHV